MRLFFNTLILMLVLTLSAQVIMLKKEIDDLDRRMVLMNLDPKKVKPFTVKRFKPQPLKDCPWVLAEPVPEHPTPPDIL